MAKPTGLLEYKRKDVGNRETSQRVKDFKEIDIPLSPNDLKNQADSTVFQTEKFIKENGDKISEEQKAEVEAAIEPVKKALEAEDYDAMKTTLDVLNEKMQAAATEMYSQAQGAEGAPEPDMGADAGGGEKPASDVEEADFEMVDEDEKDKK